MSNVAEHSDLPGVARLLSLSDGVVAIALTLLVLNLHVPTTIHHSNSAPDLASALATDGPAFTSYIVSFYVIAQFWLAHHRVFRLVAGHDEGLAWWNFAFLFTITIMPFTSDLLGEFSNNPLAVDIFALNLLLAALSTQLVLIFGRRKKMLVANIDPIQTRVGQIRSFGVIAVVAASMGVAWINTDAAKYMWILLVAVPRIADRIAGRPSGGAGLAPRLTATPNLGPASSAPSP
jgi:uncharacterized membrane protein